MGLGLRVLNAFAFESLQRLQNGREADVVLQGGWNF